MSVSDLSELQLRKKEIREKAHAARNAQPEKDALSRQIVDRFMGLPEYARARSVMFYVDVRSEVRTRQHFPDALASGKRIIIPYCVDGELELFHLESMDELSVGMYKILEPKVELRAVPAKRIAVEELDLIMVPGVALIAVGRGRAMAWATTTSCSNMLDPTRRWWRWRSNARCSRRCRWPSTTSSWTKSSPKRPFTRAEGGL